MKFYIKYKNILLIIFNFALLGCINSGNTNQAHLTSQTSLVKSKQHFYGKFMNHINDNVPRLISIASQGTNAVAVGNMGLLSLTTNSGKSWTDSFLDPSFDLYAVAANLNGSFIGLGVYGDRSIRRLIMSPNEYNTLSFGFGTGWIYPLTGMNGLAQAIYPSSSFVYLDTIQKYVSIGEPNSQDLQYSLHIASSSDGFSWNDIPFIADQKIVAINAIAGFTQITPTEQVTIAVGSLNGSDGIIYKSTSPDFSSKWESTYYNESTPIMAITQINPMGPSTNHSLVAVGENGFILLSNNGGDNWAQIQSGITTNLNAVTSGYTEASDSTVVVVGDLGIILFSTDNGNTWSHSISESNVTGVDLYDVKLVGSNFIAVGQNNTKVNIVLKVK